MNAEPGDLVECIDDKPSRKGLPVKVELGRIYLVQDVCLSPQSKRQAYCLKGVVDKNGDYWPQSQYRFRKVKPPELKKPAQVSKSKKLEDA